MVKKPRRRRGQGGLAKRKSSLPPELRRKREVSEVVNFFSAKSHQGPLPDPETLAAYESIVPGVAEVIVGLARRRMDMAETQLAHRQDLESHVIKGRMAFESRGQVMGFVLALLLIGFSAFLIYRGEKPAGFMMLAGTVISLLVANKAGKAKQDSELADKRNQVSGA